MNWVGVGVVKIFLIPGSIFYRVFLYKINFSAKYRIRVEKMSPFLLLSFSCLNLLLLTIMLFWIELNTYIGNILAFFSDDWSKNLIKTDILFFLAVHSCAFFFFHFINQWILFSAISNCYYLTTQCLRSAKNLFITFQITV